MKIEVLGNKKDNTTYKWNLGIVYGEEKTFLIKNSHYYKNIEDINEIDEEDIISFIKNDDSDYEKIIKSWKEERN